MEVKTSDAWRQPKQIQEQFGICRITVYRILDKMRQNPDFASGVLDVNSRLHLINLPMFLHYLQHEDKQYVKMPMPPEALAAKRKRA